MTDATEDMQQIERQDLLVPLENYLSAGIHIGMTQRTKAMSKYIYKVRSDRLAFIDVRKIDEQIELAAKMLSKYSPEDIIVVSRKKIGHKSIQLMSKSLGTRAVPSRFMPGTLTNPYQKGYIEPKIMLVSDPFADKQAVKEAFNANIPIIALCDTYSSTQFIDLVVPLNNKGRRSVALLYWILTREILKLQGKIKGDAEFKYTIDDFEMPPEAENESFEEGTDSEEE